MPNDALRTAIRHVHTRIIATQAGNVPDGRLLDLYLTRKEEGAFEALVRRHGPMVFGVCLRILHDAHDAEDACQATFLVFAQKAATLRRTDAVGNWLYGVAYHTAVRLRDKMLRRRKHERQAANQQPAETGPPSAWSDLREVIDEELHRLAEPYRSAIVLCHLEGKTKEKAAEQLGVPEGTVSSRLARGRELLRNRLTRRGITLSAAGVGTTLSEAVAQAALSAEFIGATVKAAVSFSTGKVVAAGMISVSVAALTKGMIYAMWMTKVKIAAAVVVAIGVLGGGAPVAGRYALTMMQAAGVEETLALSAVADAGASDLKRFQGVWAVAAAEDDGKEASTDELKQADIRFSFTGDTIAISKKRGTERVEGLRGTFVIGPTKHPKTIDLTFAADPARANKNSEERRALGLYKFEGDTLTICWDKERPAQFKTRPRPEPDKPRQKNDGLAERMYVLKRVAKTENSNQDKLQSPVIDLAGKVTTDRRQPVADAIVAFIFKPGGDTFTARTDDKGDFALKLADPRAKGAALPVRYTVTVSKKPIIDGVPSEETLPLYADPRKTPIEFELPEEIPAEGVKDVEIVLESKLVKPANHPWRKTLSSGVTIELLGVSEHPSGPKTWWNPDGKTLDEAPYDKFGGKLATPEDRRREFAVRMKNAVKDMTYRWEIIPPGSYASSSVEKGGKHLADVAAIAVALPQTAGTGQVRFGVAVGAWKAEAISGPRGGESTGRDKNIGILFGKAREARGITGVTVSHNLLDQDARVVAVDLKGQIHTPNSASGSGAGSIRHLDAEFALPQEQIKEFQFQTRPFEWAEFKDVPLSSVKKN